MELLRYPRTLHVAGTRNGEDRFADLESWTDGVIVVEEKLDGANCAISFDSRRKLRLQSRGHWLDGGPGQSQWGALKAWAAAHQKQLWDLLEDQLVCYGEYLYATHSIYYDQLPHWFFEFDLYDRAENKFWSTQARHGHLEGGPVLSVPVLTSYTRVVTAKELSVHIGTSVYRSESWEHTARAAGASDATLDILDKGTLAEGVYLKYEKGDYCIDRAKIVRPEFTQTIVDGPGHWAERPLLPNTLADGTDIYAVKRQ